MYEQHRPSLQKGEGLRSLAEPHPEAPFLSPPRLPSSVYLVSSLPFRVCFRPLFCYSMGGPRKRKGGTPLRAILDPETGLRVWREEVEYSGR